MTARQQLERAEAFSRAEGQPPEHLERPTKGLTQTVSLRPQAARIYREGGSWWSIQPDPSGGEVRTRYPNGRAAMVALDERNRETAGVRPSTALAPAGIADHMTLLIVGHSATLLPGQCPPSIPTTKDRE